MYSILVAIAVAAPPPNLAQIANEDIQRYGGKDNSTDFYIVADTYAANVLTWVLSSTSLQQEIELCTPQRVGEHDLWRINIDALLWRSEDWRAVLAANPYGGYSRLIRGDWLIREILDTVVSASRRQNDRDEVIQRFVAKGLTAEQVTERFANQIKGLTDGVPSYLRLLYRGEPPKTEAEFLAFWEIDNDAKRFRGQIEGKSQVNQRGRRWVETRDRHSGYFWITRDSFALRIGSDPLEHPSGDFQHDGSEAIVGVEKISSRTLQRGTVQYYLLTDGTGQLVNSAPVRLVEDATRFGNRAEITTWGSCLQCHVEGIRPLDTNALTELHTQYDIYTIASSPSSAAALSALADIRRFHFGSLKRTIQRNQEDYAEGIRLHTGWTSQELIEAVQTIVAKYDADVTLEAAAIELGTTPELLRSKVESYAVARKDTVTFPVPVGIAGLVRGRPCSRDLFEQQFGLLNDLVLAKEPKRDSSSR